MGIDFTSVLYGPIYAALGVPITFILANDDVIEVRGLDKTSGLEITEGQVDVQTVRPAAVLRMADLASIEVAPDDLMDAVADINGASWKVKSYYPRSSPNGVNDGELFLILEEAP